MRSTHSTKAHGPQVIASLFRLLLSHSIFVFFRASVWKINKINKIARLCIPYSTFTTRKRCGGNGFVTHRTRTFMAVLRLRVMRLLLCRRCCFRRLFHPTNYHGNFDFWIIQWNIWENRYGKLSWSIWKTCSSFSSLPTKSHEWTRIRTLTFIHLFHLFTS